MKEHKLKILYRYLVDINENGKTFEIRKNDRNFQKGDVVSFIPISETKALVIDASLHTKYRITYVFYGGEYGLDEDYCVFGIEPIKEQNSNNTKSPCCDCKSDKASCCGCPEYFEWEKRNG